MERIWIIPVLVSILILGLFGSVYAASPLVVPAGFDSMKTSPPSEVDFNPPIPADFFGPGSDPFSDIFPVEGSGSNSGFGPSDFEFSSSLFDSSLFSLFLGSDVSLADTDTVVERQGAADLPNIGSMDTIPIEIVEMKLVSSSPITVTFNGGQDPEFWDVEVQLSDSQAPGTMTLTRTGPNSGTFDSSLPVSPVFTFTKVGEPSVMQEFDFFLEGISPSIITSTDVPWTVEITDNFTHAKWFGPFESGPVPVPVSFDVWVFDPSPINASPPSGTPTLICSNSLCTIDIPNFIDELDTKIIEIKVEYPLTELPTQVEPVVTCFDSTGQSPGNLVYTGTANLIANFVIYEFECKPNPDSERIVITLPPTVVSIEIWTESFDDPQIGGTFVPIDQSALLLAGVQSVSMWMIPVILAGIGIGVFMIKRKK